MAKRKRLTPARSDYLEGSGVPVPSGPMALGPAPIAQVAGDAAARAALAEVSAEFEAARDDGRVIDLLPLSAVDDGYLVRDRMVQDEEDLAALMDSIRARGQQTPVEVIRLPTPVNGATHGLISGWRRLTALRRLCSETGDDRFATVRARVVSPDTAQAAYVAMVEENEIRVNLSFYERARIAVQAMREGVYPTQRAALQGLFGTTTRSRRSKIGTFIALVEAFDGDLAHPTAISEKLGLALAREILRNPDFVSKVRNRLASAPERTAAEEMRLLALAVEEQRPAAPGDAVEPRPQAPAGKAGKPEPQPGRVSPSPTIREYAAPGVSVSFHPGKGRIELTGPAVDEALLAALKDWLARR